MEKKGLLAVFLAALLPLPASADSIEPLPGQPTHYEVQRGDTLWDIAGRFLSEPWLWPRIWERNPHIQNPHLIYPGDVVALEYVDGKPVLRVRRSGARPTLKLSPQARVVETDTAIPAIPVDVIAPFLSSSRVVDEGSIEAAGYVVSVGRERLLAATDSRVYVRGITAEPGTRLEVFRPGQVYRAGGEDSGEILGYEALHVADAVVERTGDPATVLIRRSTREILRGDRLLPEDWTEHREPYLPRTPELPVMGSIISVVDGVRQIGRYNVVVLDRGSRDGLTYGDVLLVYQRGEVIEDTVAPPPEPPVNDLPFPHSFDKDLQTLIKQLGQPIVARGELIALPDERAGAVMVFRPFDRVSYALVMEAERVMHVRDVVASPELP